MSAPHTIVALLESVVGAYLSDIRHRERAAFILCDQLVEMVCKTRAKEEDKGFSLKCTLAEAMEAKGVGLTPDDGLGARLADNRKVRNTMQHGEAAFTIDGEHCADAILAAVETIEHCWPGTAATSYRPSLNAGLRVVALYSSSGDPGRRHVFEDAMRDHKWSGEERRLNVHEIAVRPGNRSNWGHTVLSDPSTVEEILNRVLA